MFVGGSVGLFLLWWVFKKIYKKNITDIFKDGLLDTGLQQHHPLDYRS